MCSSGLNLNLNRFRKREKALPSHRMAGAARGAPELARGREPQAAAAAHHAAIFRICQQDAVRLPPPPGALAGPGGGLRSAKVVHPEGRGVLADLLALASKRALSVAFVLARQGGLGPSNRLAAVHNIIVFAQVGTMWGARGPCTRVHDRGAVACFPLTVA